MVFTTKKPKEIKEEDFLQSKDRDILFKKLQSKDIDGLFKNQRLILEKQDILLQKYDSKNKENL
jgi:hypothetical protein